MPVIVSPRFSESPGQPRPAILAPTALSKPDIPVAHAKSTPLVAPTQGLLHLPPRIPFGDGFSLIVLPLALRQTDIHLCPPIAQHDPQRDEGIPACFHFLCEVSDLRPVQEQFARPVRVVLVVVPSLAVRRDMHSVQPDLPILNARICLANVDAPRADRLDLGSRQHDPGFDLLLDVVIMPGTAIRHDDLFAIAGRLRFRCHRPRTHNLGTLSVAGRRIKPAHPKGGSGMSHSETYDAVVIGAGINGCGIARDAARRGFSTLLIDTGDIGGGTTAASTRLIHGGLRYLEHGDLRLVRQSLRERNTLLRIAPHLVRPLPFLLPIYATGRRSLRRVRIGLALYQALDAGSPLPASRILTARETLALEPRIDATNLVGGATYWDAQVAFPERLALENALDARANGAEIRTHVSAVELAVGSQGVEGVAYSWKGVPHSATAPLVVNATGPWVDQLVQPHDDRALIAGTRGTHIVARAELDAPRHAIYAEAADGRPFFVIPWNHLLLVGTTDVPHPTLTGCVEPNATEVAYLIENARRILPHAGISAESLCYAYAGVRPLGRSRRRNPASISRSHAIVAHAGHLRGMLSVVGGELTTYRELSQQVVDILARRASTPSRPCDTHRARLPGASAPEGPDWSGVDSLTTERLISVYGGQAWAVVGSASAQRELHRPLCPGVPALAAEVTHAIEHEMATTVADVLLRRTMLGLGADQGLACLEQVGTIAIEHCGWSPEAVAEQISAYRAFAERRRAATTRNAGGRVESGA